MTKPSTTSGVTRSVSTPLAISPAMKRLPRSNRLLSIPWASKPTKRQLERGLTDKFLKVRSAFYRRGDVVLSNMQKERARKGGFNVFSSTSLEEHDEPDTICPFCKTWILAEEDTWCKHLAYIHLPPFFYGGIEKGPSAKAKYEQWLKKNSVNLYDCSARKFDIFCKNFGFKKRFVSGSETAGFECGKIIYAFVDDKIVS